MSPSPWRRRRKPRPTQPCPAHTHRLCEPCLSEYLQLALEAAGQLAFPHEHWLTTAGSLLVLCLARYHARSCTTGQHH
ncbi:hypothetical protein ACFRI7_00455 [Streptomyces sp. NPDC056716]|uniref:hypothetical protein n=1 Tax=unclassified Streptomyces TaxID=2593676 RepID=UPI0036CA7EBE